MRIRYTSAIALFVSLAACSSDSTAPPGPAKPGTDLFLDGARTAWTFVENNTNASTGLAKAHDTFQFVTIWDIASQIGATYSAHELGIIDDGAYDGRIRKILGTLTTMPLFDGVAFNRFYDSQTGTMVGRDFTASSVGFGWSDTDMGRLLIWLRVLAVNQPQYANQATAIVNRLNMSRLISGGTLQGMNVDPNTGARIGFAETGLGYEQYAAGGFALWGQRATNSLNPTANAQTMDVLGVTVFVDRRGPRLTSEPYIMMGLETGWWASALRDQAQAVLAAQQARFDQKGIVTMATEDAMPDPPYFFYYYYVYGDGAAFVVEGPVHGTIVSSPRWVSSKAAFAWRALLPTDYTLTAFNTVQAAAIPGDGWGAGVYEGSLKPTGGATLNTNSMILEAALYHQRGQPFLSQPIN